MRLNLCTTYVDLDKEPQPLPISRNLSPNKLYSVIDIDMEKGKKGKIFIIILDMNGVEVRANFTRVDG